MNPLPISVKKPKAKQPKYLFVTRPSVVMPSSFYLEVRATGNNEWLLVGKVQQRKKVIRRTLDRLIEGIKTGDYEIVDYS